MQKYEEIFLAYDTIFEYRSRTKKNFNNHCNLEI